jgi:hypothetical protein
MLGGAGLAPHFWPYAVQHFLRMYNVTPHRDRLASPFSTPLLLQLSTIGRKPRDESLGFYSLHMAFLAPESTS